MKDDLYDTLGVDKSASKAEIKKAYRKKAKNEHPDAGGNNEKFTAIAKAYNILSDDEKRKRYDETGDTEQVKIDPVQRMKYDLLNEIVSKCPEDFKNYLQFKLHNFENESTRAVQALRLRISELEKFKKRIKKYPEDKPVNMHLLIFNSIRSLENDIETHNETLEHITQAINELISEYDIENESERYTFTGSAVFGRMNE